MKNKAQKHQNFVKHTQLFLTLIFLLIFTTNAFSETVRLYNPNDGNFVNYGFASGFFFQPHISPLSNGTKKYSVYFEQDWNYSDFKNYVKNEISGMGDSNSFKCDNQSTPYTKFNVDVLKDETIVASYNQYFTMSGGYVAGGCNRENSTIPSGVNSNNFPPFPFKEYVNSKNYAYAQPNNISNDYDCDVNKFWIQFYLDNDYDSGRLMCDDDPTKLDTCVKSFRATKSGVWEVRFGSGVVYEAIHCDSSANKDSRDYNSFYFERKWGIDNWDINVIPSGQTEPSLGRVWLPAWSAAGFTDLDVNFFVLASAIGNDSAMCEWEKALYGQKDWNNCYSEYFKIVLNKFSLSWSSIRTNETGIHFDNNSTLKSLPMFAYVHPDLNAIKGKTYKKLAEEAGRSDYNGCGNEYYWFNVGYETPTGFLRPSLRAEGSQRMYINEPAFSKKPGDYNPSVKVTEKIDSYVFDINVGENVSKYYDIYIDVDKDNQFFDDSNDFVAYRQIVNGSSSYVWNLIGPNNQKLPSGDYNYLIRFYSSLTNIPVIGSRSKLNIQLERKIGGEMKSDLLYWDDTEIGGELKNSGSKLRSWDGYNLGRDACDNSGSILRYNCFCMDKTPNLEKITAFYDLNQSVGYHDAMNTWAYGDVTEYRGGVRVIIIDNQLLDFKISVVDENTIKFYVDCASNTTLDPDDLNNFYDEEGNKIPLKFTSDLNCNAGGSEIIATTSTPLQQDGGYVFSGSVVGGSGTQFYLNYDNPNKPKANIPDNNIFVVVFLFSLVVFFISKKRK
ncbi:MAG: hypothetical protein GX950_03300 [Candidatus Diapherotrites archaeon]|uniref:Uncharacterized protein n=1 Tax=Candidatus Iainarchaeum sp. TaxID=3101447 RepID=A0A7K4BZZ7_9ARCH|nr:hypothetical protein [Candidatus Diapherotrites archaeon]